MIFWKPALLLSAGKEAPKLIGPHTSTYSQSLGTIETLNLLRYVPENSSSPWVVTGK